MRFSLIRMCFWSGVYQKEAHSICTEEEPRRPLPTANGEMLVEQSFNNGNAEQRDLTFSLSISLWFLHERLKGKAFPRVMSVMSNSIFNNDHLLDYLLKYGVLEYSQHVKVISLNRFCHYIGSSNFHRRYRASIRLQRWWRRWRTFSFTISEVPLRVSTKNFHSAKVGIPTVDWIMCRIQGKRKRFILDLGKYGKQIALIHEKRREWEAAVRKRNAIKNLLHVQSYVDTEISLNRDIKHFLYS